MLELDSPSCVDSLASDPLEASPAEPSLRLVDPDSPDEPVACGSDPSEAPEDVLDLRAALGASLAGVRVLEDVDFDPCAVLWALELAALALCP